MDCLQSDTDTAITPNKNWPGELSIRLTAIKHDTKTLLILLLLLKSVFTHKPQKMCKHSYITLLLLPKQFSEKEGKKKKAWILKEKALSAGGLLLCFYCGEEGGDNSLLTTAPICNTICYSLTSIFNYITHKIILYNKCVALTVIFKKTVIHIRI